MYIDTQQIIRTRLQKFMHALDDENRGNRLSEIMLGGLGGFLEKLIMEIIDEINNVKHQKEGK